MTDVQPVITPAPDTGKKNKRGPSQGQQMVTASLLFPLLLVIPGVQAWVALNPAAYASLQGLLTVALHYLNKKLKVA